MSNAIYNKVVKHLQSGPDKRIAIGVARGYKTQVFSASDLPKIKAEGNGLRIGKVYVFDGQVLFCKVTSV